MTARELRKMLFNVENQWLTVQELRQILFEIEEQDEVLEESTLSKLTR